MYELCDRRAESAEQFRAVNTVVNEGGVLVGHNTDGVGWSRALREAFGRGPGELRILLLGAGGAGRAIATRPCSRNVRFWSSRIAKGAGRWTWSTISRGNSRPGRW